MKQNNIEPGLCVNCGQFKKPSFREYYCDCHPRKDWDAWKAKFEKVTRNLDRAWARMCEAPFYLEHSECEWPFLFLTRKPLNGEVLQLTDFVPILNEIVAGIKPCCETCGEVLSQKIIAEDVYPNPYFIPF